MVILQLEEQPPLIQAVFSGEIDTVKRLLEAKQDVNYQDFEKRSALHAAAYRGDALLTEILIEHGARVNTKDCRWVTPLHRACCSGSEETVCILLKNQADTGARDRLWQTPLHIAAAYNSLDCVQYLLERVQNPNVTDRSGRTALHHAVLNGHNDIVELLISRGCIVNACDKKDCRPIHWAAHKGHTETLEILLQNGADINAKDRNQYTPLHVAAASGSVGIIQTLLMHGAALEAQNAYGNTPLHIACLNGHGSCAQELIRHNADREAVNYRGQTPLHIAAASTHGVHCLNMLVGLEVNINRQSSDGRTALHMTAIHGRFTRSKTLIDNGAIVDSVDKNGCTALHIAAQYGHELLSSTLLTYGADPSKKGYEGRTPLHMCCLSGYIECCRIFIKAGVDLNSKDELGKTPLHCAAYKGAAECVDLLVSSGSNIKALDNLGRIPLHYAAAQGYFFCVFTLVGNGSNPNHQDYEGCTALHLAAAYDIDGKCVDYLLEHKADPKMKDLKGFTAIHYAAAGNNVNALKFLLMAMGNVCLFGPDMPPTTPLHIAAKNGNMEILETLMPYFPDPNIRNEHGCTPLLLSARQGYANCVQMLLRFGAKVSICDSITGLSPVHHSAKNGYVHCLALLVDNAEDKSIINQPDDLLRTALMLAVSNLHIDCVTTLIKSGADPNILDNDGHSCLFRAVVTGQHSVLHMLLPRSTVVNSPDVHGKTILHIAAACGRLACIQRLLPFMDTSVSKGVDKEKFTALHWACYSGNYDCVAHFIKEGVFESLQGNGFSAVHCAASAGSEKCLDILFKHYGADIVKLKDVKQRTSLHIAALHGHSDCTLYLLDHGAEIDCKDEDGRTPLMSAAMHGQTQVMEILINYKADKTASDNNGNTALHLSCLKKHNHAALLLLEFIEDSTSINMVNGEQKTPLHISARNGLVDVTRQLISKGSSVLAVDANGLTPALCCAPNPSVAQCLAIILASHPMQVHGANCKDIVAELQTLRSSIKSLIPRPAKRKRRILQTDITMVQNPDRFELEHMFDVKFDKAEADLEFKDWMGKVYVKFDNKESEQFGCPPKKRHKSRSQYHAELTSYSCHQLHGSHSDMSLALKTIYSEEDYRKLIKQSEGGVRKRCDDRPLRKGFEEVKQTEELFRKGSSEKQTPMCSFRYDIPEDTDTDLENLDSYKEVCETLVHNYISELPCRKSDCSAPNPGRSPKATNKRLKPTKIKEGEFMEHLEKCMICKQFNLDLHEANPVHEPSIPLEIMKETVNKVLTRKGNSSNRCLYAFLNESYEINSDNAYMIFHGMVSPRCEPYIAKVLNLPEGEVEITESPEGDDKLKYWVKKTELTPRDKRLSTTRIKEIKIRSPTRNKNEKIAPKELVKPRGELRPEVKKSISRELEPRSEPSLRNRGAVPKRRDSRKLPATKPVTKSNSYDDKFPRSENTKFPMKPTETKQIRRRELAVRQQKRMMMVSTFVDGCKVDSCGENNVGVYERKLAKHQVDAEISSQYPQFLNNLSTFHTIPLCANHDGSYFRCHPTFWCVNKKENAENDDVEKTYSDSHFAQREQGESSNEKGDVYLRAELNLKSLRGVAKPQEEVIFFNDSPGLGSSSFIATGSIDDEEIEELEDLRKLDDGLTSTDSDDPSEDVVKGTCTLKRRGGLTDIQRNPKSVDMWASLTDDFLKGKFEEFQNLSCYVREDDDSASHSSRKKKLTINIPRITLSDELVVPESKDPKIVESLFRSPSAGMDTSRINSDQEVVRMKNSVIAVDVPEWKVKKFAENSHISEDDLIKMLPTKPSVDDSIQNLYMNSMTEFQSVSKSLVVKPDLADGPKIEDIFHNQTISLSAKIVKNILDVDMMRDVVNYEEQSVVTLKSCKVDKPKKAKPDNETYRLERQLSKDVKDIRNNADFKQSRSRHPGDFKCHQSKSLDRSYKSPEIDSFKVIARPEATGKSPDKEKPSIGAYKETAKSDVTLKSPEKEKPLIDVYKAIVKSEATLKSPEKEKPSIDAYKEIVKPDAIRKTLKSEKTRQNDSLISIEKNRKSSEVMILPPLAKKKETDKKPKPEVQSLLPVKKKDVAKTAEQVRSPENNTSEPAVSAEKAAPKPHVEQLSSDFLPPVLAPVQPPEEKGEPEEKGVQVTKADFKIEDYDLFETYEEFTVNDSMIVNPSEQIGNVDLEEFGISDNSIDEDDDTIAEVQSIEDDTILDRMVFHSPTLDDIKEIPLDDKPSVIEEEDLLKTMLEESSQILEKLRCEPSDVAVRTTVLETNEDDEFIARRRPTRRCGVEERGRERFKENNERRRQTMSKAHKEYWSCKTTDEKPPIFKVEYYDQPMLNIEDALQGKVKPNAKRVLFSDKVVILDPDKPEIVEQSKDNNDPKKEVQKPQTIDPEMIELSIKLPDVSFAEDILNRYEESPQPSTSGCCEKTDPKHFLEKLEIEKLVDFKDRKSFLAEEPILADEDDTFKTLDDPESCCTDLTENEYFSMALTSDVTTASMVQEEAIYESPDAVEVDSTTCEEIEDDPIEDSLGEAEILLFASFDEIPVDNVVRTQSMETIPEEKSCELSERSCEMPKSKFNIYNIKVANTSPGSRMEDCQIYLTNDGQVCQVFDNTEQFYNDEFYTSEMHLSNSDSLPKGSNTPSTSIESAELCLMQSPMQSHTQPHTVRILSDIEEDVDEQTSQMENSKVTIDETDEYTLYTEDLLTSENRGDSCLTPQAKIMPKPKRGHAKCEVSGSVVETRTSDEDLLSLNATRILNSDSALDDEDTMNIEDSLSEDDIGKPFDEGVDRVSDMEEGVAQMISEEVNPNAILLNYLNGSDDNLSYRMSNMSISNSFGYLVKSDDVVSHTSSDNEFY